jgi:hypothetical protein
LLFAFRLRQECKVANNFVDTLLNRRDSTLKFPENNTSLNFFRMMDLGGKSYFRQGAGCFWLSQEHCISFTCPTTKRVALSCLNHFCCVGPLLFFLNETILSPFSHLGHTLSKLMALIISVSYFDKRDSYTYVCQLLFLRHAFISKTLL